MWMVILVSVIQSSKRLEAIMASVTFKEFVLP